MTLRREIGLIESVCGIRKILGRDGNVLEHDNKTIINFFKSLIVSLTDLSVRVEFTYKASFI